MHAARAKPVLMGVLACAGALCAGGEARADAPPVVSRGLAVVAEGDAGPAAQSLARAVYADPGLLPPTLDEARAHALVGDPLEADAPREVRDIADSRAALHGDDGPSRSLLVGLGTQLHVKGLVVVTGHPGDRPAARVFVMATGAFDAASYEPDSAAIATWGGGTQAVRWSGAVAGLHRGFAEAAVPAFPSPAVPGVAPTGTNVSAALEPTPAPIRGEKSAGSKPFYTSPWFWGAIGAAAFAGAAFYFASRDASSPNIQLQVQVPK